MKKFFSEFKQFITRGNVIDLAVGMIIGAAFTAIVTALVNGVFKPLIDAIPMGDVEGLVTVLVAKTAAGGPTTVGAEDFDLASSIYINWGDLIMAIITFFLTALVLFLIIKVINSVREKSKRVSEKQRARIEKRLAKGEISAEEAAKEEAAVEEAAAPAETTDDLLREIRDLLKASKE